MTTNEVSTRERTTTTEALLACGALGIPLFLVVFHVDAVTRPGFALLHHGPSLLMTGDRGWLQITNFLATGALMLACAVGLRLALPTGRASRWGPRLMGGYGVAMMCTGIFVTDPQLGYPPGTPSGRLPGINADESWHSQLHTLSVLVLYLIACVACFVFARRFGAEPGGRWWAAGLVANGVVAPVVLVVGAFVLQPLSVSSRWAALADGVAGRIIIPLGWLWAAAVAGRVLLAGRRRSVAR